MLIRDRILRVEKVKASSLLPNPRNWRTHPTAQVDALKGVLSEVGIAGVLLARETPDGLMLIDGHARAEIDADTEWTVAVLDVTEREADYLLATHDPLGAMAGADSLALGELLHGVNSGNAAVQEMLAGLYQVPEQLCAPESFKEFDEGISTDHTCPKCGYAWSGGE